MGYATKQNLIDRFGAEELIQLTDRATPPAGVINDTGLNQALADAHAGADGYLGPRQTPPLPAGPPQRPDGGGPIKNS